MPDQPTLILVSANSEWQAVKEILAPPKVDDSQFGEVFDYRHTIFLHGGWGKVSAAASTQYFIDRFRPQLLINLGTCGGFEGRVERGTIILVTKTIIYDIFEQMTDPEDAISHYTTEIDKSWLPYPLPYKVQPGLLISGDRDIIPKDIPILTQKYGAIAADWESGSIAWVANTNGVRCLILRGVTDLVNSQAGEAYGNISIFHENTKSIMKTLIDQLPVWLETIA
jgi:adenosylhomocysteine nucleosidase